MLGRPAAVGFDLDGTLFDHRASAAEAASAFLRSLGARPDGRALDVWFRAEAVRFEQWRRGELDFAGQRRARLRDVMGELGLGAPRSDAVADAAFARYLAAYRAAWRAFDDARAALDGLRAEGVRVGILTNGVEAQQRDKLAVIGLLDRVDALCASETIGVAKPDVRAFERLAAELGVAPASMAFVGDDPEKDLAGATAAGMRAALVAPARGSTSAGLADALAAVGLPIDAP
ncbi:HAD family hydrolase [Agrococcus sp. SL85]|uniref:HAD family hydrolase n=1 Tax=Agrococcus sp. SL85 TaxID=2995141 RepID=UPI00226D22FC|nr:HAD family hydrolase [Agrococcus sp. SL85]WAC65494.1 HAD family hydrolase [Agrococcus sp. SL85]